MSEKLKIAPDGWVVVCDEHKALILRNHGDEDYPTLSVQQVLEAPPTADARTGDRQAAPHHLGWTAKSDPANRLAARLQQLRREGRGHRAREANSS